MSARAVVRSRVTRAPVSTQLLILSATRFQLNFVRAELILSALDGGVVEEVWRRRPPSPPPRPPPSPPPPSPPPRNLRWCARPAARSLPTSASSHRGLGCSASSAIPGKLTGNLGRPSPQFVTVCTYCTAVSTSTMHLYETVLEPSGVLRGAQLYIHGCAAAAPSTAWPGLYIHGCAAAVPSTA